MSVPRFACFGLAVILTLAVTTQATVPAYAADPDVHYPTFSAVAETSGEYSTTATFPNSGPTASVVANRPLNTATSATLDADTPFGQVFGSSAEKTYVRVDVKATAPSVTTITFNTELQANQLGIALGDIDAESVKVTMLDGATTPVALSAAQMGARAPFNYAGQPDLPTITSGTDEITVADGRCVDPGQECDTTGATAWFQPQSAVKTITLTGTKISGLPEYQLWLAFEDYQTVTWAPTTSLALADSPFTPSNPPVASDNGTITYSVANAGATGCTVNSTTGVITASSAGTCQVTATAAATTNFLSGSTTVAFIIDEEDPQKVSWDPTTTITLTEAPLSFFPDDLPNSTGNGTKSYTVADSGSAQCTVNSSTGQITAQSPGSCDITATAAATSAYAEGSTTVTFTFVAPPAPPTNSDRDDDDLQQVLPVAQPARPELAATGPVVANGLWWATAALTIGVALLVAARLTPGRSSRP